MKRIYPITLYCATCRTHTGWVARIVRVYEVDCVGTVAPDQHEAPELHCSVCRDVYGDGTPWDAISAAKDYALERVQAAP